MFHRLCKCETLKKTLFFDAEEDRNERCNFVEMFAVAFIRLLEMRKATLTW